MRLVAIAYAMMTLLISSSVTRAESPEEWAKLGARVHGGYGSFIPLGVRIGLDAVERLKAKPRELSLYYHDSDKAPCAFFADGVAIATVASVGQRTVTIMPEKAPDGAAAIIVVRPRKGGVGFKYTIPMSSLPRLRKMNEELDPIGRHEAVMKAEGLFEVTSID
jgi:formylmethanofuran dehydrogenase subunit E